MYALALSLVCVDVMVITSAYEVCCGGAGGAGGCGISVVYMWGRENATLRDELI